MSMIPDEIFSKIRRSLIKHEGYEDKPYLDTSIPPKVTIGIGYCLSDRGISHDWIETQFAKDVNYFYKRLFCDFPFFHSLNYDRQTVLVDMCFMGYTHFCEFHSMLNALEVHDYDKAAEEMLNSKWAEQVKGRAIELSNAMRSGVYNV